MSEDPIGFTAGDTNLYRYVENRPLLLNDPSGKNPAAIVGGIAGGIIGGITGGTQSSASCFAGKLADTFVGVATGAAGGILLGFGVGTGAGIISSGFTSVGGSIAGLGPAAISIFGDFGSKFCSPPPPPEPTCGN